MTVLYGRCSPFQKLVSTECSHGRSAIVRGVVSGSAAGTAKTLPAEHGRTPRGIMRSSEMTSCRCGVPSYLMGLDEPCIDYALANFIASLNRERKTQRAETRIVSAIRRRGEFHSGLR